jgi:predicted nucleotidyltransferase component of viral defense system
MTLNPNIHRTILLQILKEIYSNSSLGPALGFKGGTAAYLFHKLDRFSVDLDFDLLDETKEDYVFEKIQTIIGEYGKIKEARHKRHTIFFLLSYDENSQNIKVEVNRRNFGSKYEVKSIFGISVLTMKTADMFAHKLCALTERKTNRDIFDVHFFLKHHWPLNEEIIKLRTGLPLKKYLKKCIGHLEKISDRQILNGIGELLDEKQKAWAKTNLRKDTIFLLKVMEE